MSTDTKKIKFNYFNQTNESTSDNKFIKVLPGNTQISDLISLCLKNNENESMIDIYINDTLIKDENLNKPLSDFGPKPIVIFKSKPGNICTFYTIKNINGKNVTYDPNKNQDFMKLVGINDETDKYFIFDPEGKKININNDNYKKFVKDGANFYLLNYPKTLEQLSPPKLFDTIAQTLEINLEEFRLLLCILDKMKEDKEDYNIIMLLSIQKKYTPFSSLSSSFLNSLKNSEVSKDMFLKFVFSLSFIKNKESYSKLFENLSRKKSDASNPFSVFDTKDFVHKSNIAKNTIIKINNNIFGVYKCLPRPGFYQYYDPYECKVFTKSINYSDIKDPSQITAIFVDTSGSMVASFNHTKKRLYQAAVEIANELIYNISEFNIRNYLIVSTSFKDKLEPDQIPLDIDIKDVDGRTNIWDKIDFFINEIKKKNGKNKCPSHILIITDGEDTNSTKPREDILIKINKENIIVDSIVLCDNEFSQDPLTFSTYTNGVYLFATDIKQAKDFVSIEPFFNLSIRKKMYHKHAPNCPFGHPNKIKPKYHRFEQLELYGNHIFYENFDFGLLKPCPENFNKIDHILAKELYECLKKEEKEKDKDPKYYTFLIQNSEVDETKIKKEEDDYDDDDDEKEKEEDKLIQNLYHWCVFIKFESKNKKKPYFWQMKIDFDSKHPESLPTMRIISHPELIKQNQEYISPFGTIRFYKLLNNPKEHYSVSELLDKLIDKLKDIFDYDDFEPIYVNSPLTAINTNLAKIINVTFENGWEKLAFDDEEIDEIKEDKIETKIEEKPEDKSETKKDEKLENKSEEKPETKKEEKPKDKSETKKEEKPKDKSETKKEEKLEDKSETKKDEKPEKKSEEKPETKKKDKPAKIEKTETESNDDPIVTSSGADSGSQKNKPNKEETKKKSSSQSDPFAKSQTHINIKKSPSPSQSPSDTFAKSHYLTKPTSSKQQPNRPQKGKKDGK